MSDDEPPFAFIKLIATHCPNALYVYIELFMRKENGMVVVKKENIKRDFCISKTLFENNLMLLVREALVSVVYETFDEIHIEMIGEEDIFEMC
jgi:hypothetical protein